MEQLEVILMTINRQSKQDREIGESELNISASILVEFSKKTLKKILIDSSDRTGSDLVILKMDNQEYRTHKSFDNDNIWGINVSSSMGGGFGRWAFGNLGLVNFSVSVSSKYLLTLSGTSFSSILK